MILRACFDRLGGRNVGRKVDAKYNLGSWLRASVFMGTLGDRIFTRVRSEEHTSELQSRP